MDNIYPFLHIQTRNLLLQSIEYDSSDVFNYLISEGWDPNVRDDKDVGGSNLSTECEAKEWFVESCAKFQKTDRSAAD